MTNSIQILKIYPESFSANFYTMKPFRMIGLIDASIKYSYGVERVTLAFFRSSGTNSGKIKGLWYPIVGIKTHTGRFIEFTNYLNFILTNSTRRGEAKKGWLAKSLFFAHENEESSIIRGFSNGAHYKSLLKIGETLRELYENNEFQEMYLLTPNNLNAIVTSKEIYNGNKCNQRENFERLMGDIYNENIIARKIPTSILDVNSIKRTNVKM